MTRAKRYVGLVLRGEVGKTLRALAIPEQLLHINCFYVLRRRQERDPPLTVERQLAR